MKKLITIALIAMLAVSTAPVAFAETVTNSEPVAQESIIDTVESSEEESEESEASQAYEKEYRLEEFQLPIKTTYTKADLVYHEDTQDYTLNIDPAEMQLGFVNVDDSNDVVIFTDKDIDVTFETEHIAAEDIDKPIAEVTARVIWKLKQPDNNKYTYTEENMNIPVQYDPTAHSTEVFELESFTKPTKLTYTKADLKYTENGEAYLKLDLTGMSITIKNTRTGETKTLPYNYYSVSTESEMLEATVTVDDAVIDQNNIKLIVTPTFYPLDDLGNVQVQENQLQFEITYNPTEEESSKQVVSTSTSTPSSNNTKNTTNDNSTVQTGDSSVKTLAVTLLAVLMASSAVVGVASYKKKFSK